MQIRTKDNTTILSIRAFLGLNENPDGDTAIKTGEMAEMRNFRITQDGHLQIRPGSKTVLTLADADGAAGKDRLWGVWRGMVGAREHVLAAYGGGVFDVDLTAASARRIGNVSESDTSFFGFNAKAYLLNGTDYLCWDGEDDTEFEEVEGYIPLVQTATAPGGAGTLLEPVNRLTTKKRVRFSPDGSAATFQLPEKELREVVKVELDGDETTDFAADTAAGTVTLNSAPAAGTNTLEVTYDKGEDASGEVKAMRYAELYNGATDTRVFLYGDGSCRTIYSGIEYATGHASAEYFPDLYEISVGEANTPLTALVRHYSRLMAFKPNSAWVIQYGTLTLEDASTTAAFYCQPVNRQFGNEAPGQVKLLENNPLTLDAGSIYQWKPSGYSSYVSSNENNAKRISDRVVSTLKALDVTALKTFNLKSDHEYWFMPGDGTALIFNYANNTWYSYAGLPFERLIETEGGEKFGFGNDGRVVRFSRSHRNDDGAPIDCYAATGAMDFGRDWLLKYSPMLFVAMQPESGARVTVTVESNRRSDYPGKLVAYNLATFEHMDFNHFSFATNRKPQVKRVKMKVKKATFYRLIFKSNSASATATVIETDVKLRYAGNVK